MSETIAMPPLGDIESRSVPTVYFIDDSATMREVIKIAFRRESIHVITCPDAASALAQFQEYPPDCVITDVIMPDQDGYSVCSQIKQSPQYSKTPVILMSGVVTKNVADRAVAVQADELVRKPFQPQELIGRVKNLLAQANPVFKPAAQEEAPVAAASLRGLFATPQGSAPAPLSVVLPVVHSSVPEIPESKTGDSVWPRALAEAFLQQNAAQQSQPQQAQGAQPTAPANTRSGGTSPDAQKLRAEIGRLDLLVKKLQAELQIERQYNQSLELHVRSLIQID
jgi:CheY-like chemotaxis protein